MTLCVDTLEPLPSVKSCLGFIFFELVCLLYAVRRHWRMCACVCVWRRPSLPLLVLPSFPSLPIRVPSPRPRPQTDDPSTIPSCPPPLSRLFENLLVAAASVAAASPSRKSEVCATGSWLLHYSLPPRVLCACASRCKRVVWAYVLHISLPPSLHCDPCPCLAPSRVLFRSQTISRLRRPPHPHVWRP